MEHVLRKTFLYFDFFEYAPTLEELWMFHTEKITIKDLEEHLEQNTIYTSRSGRWTRTHTKHFLNQSQQKEELANQKKKQVAGFIKLLSRLPQVQLIGLSGSVAMNNAKEQDDVDLFIITAPHRLWTARLAGLLLAQVMGLRRMRGVKHARDKVCLNLFFDRRDLAIPRKKRSEYGAHEVLQMKPLVNKRGAYESFLNANKWVRALFPNVEIPQSVEGSTRATSPFGTVLEFICKKIQLTFMSRHRTVEYITDSQLWFFPEDFEKKMK